MNNNGDSPLSLAVSRLRYERLYGNEVVVSILLQHGADPNLPNRLGQCSLHLCAHLFFPASVIDTLVKGGADPTIRDSSGHTALYYLACKGGPIDALKILVDGCEVEDRELRDLWQAASSYGEFDMLAYLLDLGADPNWELEEHFAIFGLTKSLYAKEEVLSLLARGARADICTKSGKNALHHVLHGDWGGIHSGREDLLELFLQHGADVNAKRLLDTLTQGKHEAATLTPLGEACLDWYSNRRLITKLCLAGANPNTLTAEGKPVLHSACCEKQHSIIKTLLEAGANPNTRTSTGATALHELAKHAAKGSVNLLVRYGADPAIRDEQGRTPLFMACSGPKPTHAFRELLRHGAKIDIANDVGVTPLHIAAEAGNRGIAKEILCLAPALAQRHDNKGKLALHYAASSGSLTTVKKLVGFMQRPYSDAEGLFGSRSTTEGQEVLSMSDFLNAKDHAGKTPLHYTAMNSRKDIYLWLRSLPGVDLEPRDANNISPTDLNTDSIAKTDAILDGREIQHSIDEKEISHYTLFQKVYTAMVVILVGTALWNQSW